MSWMLKINKPPFEINGEKFWTYRRFSDRHYHISEDGQIRVNRNHGRTTYSSFYNNELVGSKYRSIEAAIKAAQKLRNKS